MVPVLANLMPYLENSLTPKQVRELFLTTDEKDGHRYR
jgi:hypothetical protein